MKFWIILGIMCAISTAPAQVKGAALNASSRCKIYEPPKNGVIACNFYGEDGIACQVHCNPGFNFERKRPLFYFCENGKWKFFDLSPAVDFAVPWPDCIQTTPSSPPAH